MKLHEYQNRAADFVVENPASFLMLEVGLGKTASTLTSIKKLLAMGDVHNVLVIAPKRVAENVWLDERDIWTPGMSMMVVTGSPADRLKAMMSKTRVKVIGRDNVTWLVDNFAKKWPFDMLVIDESQSFKDASSKRFKSLKKVAHLFDRVALLSATPCAEGLMGLWSQVFLADSGKRLGKSFTAFKQAYFQADYTGWSWEPIPQAEEQIRNRIADMTISMQAKDYLQLPDRIDNVVKVTMSSSEMDTYTRMERDYLLPIANGEAITAANAAVLWGKLHQLSGGSMYAEDKTPVHFSDVKIDALKDVIESANGAPVLVFYGYRHEVDRIKKAIKGAAEIDVAKWNAGKQPVALAHAESCGAGLNLQHGGAIAVWYSIPASLGQYIQACGRLHRQGQKQTVVIHHLVTEGTIDEDVMTALSDKAEGQERMIDALKRRISHE